LEKLIREDEEIQNMLKEVPSPTLEEIIKLWGEAEGRVKSKLSIPVGYENWRRLMQRELRAMKVPENEIRMVLNFWGYIKESTRLAEVRKLFY